ncbi:MAG: iron-containing alcohol dehydrogenase [Bacilli bacterium]
MKAFIFNSGIGSRLGDLTKDKPKALVELKNGETILGRQLRILRSVGIKHIVISTGYKAEMIKDYCRKEFPELDFTFVHNPKFDTTNSIYTMFLAENTFQDHFLIMHGDLIFDERILEKLLAEKHRDLACINTNIPKPLKDFKGRVRNGKLHRISVDIFGENDYALQPLYKLSFAAISQWMLQIKDLVRANVVNVYAENAFNNALPLLDVRVVDYKDNFIEEIDTLDDYDRVSDAVRLFDYANQKVYNGDYLVRLDEVFKKHDFKRPFIVYNAAAYKSPEYPKFIKRYETIMFDDYSPNPKYEEIMPGIKLFKENKCDVIVAIGGGSTLDVAKAIKLFSKLNPNIDFLKQTPVYVNTPLIAIPTTAGTGSETTRYAVIYASGEKQSLTHDCIFPDITIIDPTFLRSLPEYHRRSSLLDALCQAIESYWSKGATKQTREFSARAIHLFRYTYKHYLEGHPFVDDRIMKIAYLAGQAINITATTAPHAMSYKLTSLTGIAHGHAVSVTLPYTYKYMFDNMEVEKDKNLAQTFANLAKIFETDETKLFELLKTIFDEFELEKPKVTEKQLMELINDVNTERLQNNPVFLDKEAISEIYRSSLTVV